MKENKPDQDPIQAILLGLEEQYFNAAIMSNNWMRVLGACATTITFSQSYRQRSIIEESQSSILQTDIAKIGIVLSLLGQHTSNLARKNNALKARILTAQNSLPVPYWALTYPDELM